MPPNSIYQQHRSAAFYAAASGAAAACLILCGAAAMVFLYAGIAVWPFLMPQAAGLKANAIVAFVLAGFALWGQRAPLVEPDALQRLGKGIAQLLGLAVLAIGAFTLMQFVFNVDLRIDQLLYRESGVLPHPGRMSALSAACFMLAGAGLMMLDVSSRSGHYPAEYFAVLIVALMGIPLIGHLYGAVAMLEAPAAPGVPLQAVFLFMVLAAGMLAARPAHRLMAAWNSTAPGGHLLRSLLPKSILLLVGLDLAVEWGAHRGWLAQESISPMVILLTSGWLAILFWRAAAMLNREYDVRRKGEVALSESTALLRAVSDNTPDAIYVKDRHGRMIFANPATLRMLDKNAAAVIGRGSREIYGNPADAQMVEQSDRAVMASGKPQMVEETVSFPYGCRTFYSTKAPWIDERGEVLGLVGISTDITERKRVEDALREHETQLEALVTARTAEVSELIGHLEATREEEKRAIARELHDDLGSALTALNMHLAILFQQLPNEAKLADRVTQIKSLLSSVTQTTRRIQVGLRPDKLDIFGIKTAIAELAIEFEDYTGVACRVDLPDEELSYAPQIDIALFRMVQEMLNNIAKHAHATRVDIVLDDLDDRVMLSVRDNGVGMPAQQPAGTLTHGLRGMRERAGYLGGEVKIISAPGNGTSIVITLPKKTPAQSAAHAGAAAGRT